MSYICEKLRNVDHGFKKIGPDAFYDDFYVRTHLCLHK
jgi:hypothetical protein